MGGVNEQRTGHRRIDRIRDQAYLTSIDALSLDDLRARRDECLAEREYLSLLRRLVQGRAEILRAELESRGSGEDEGPLVDRLAQILAGDERQSPARGEAVKIGLPEEEMLLARRRIERLVSDAGISDPSVLDDANLASAVELLATEEREVSTARSDVIRVLDTLQDELKRRYREDPTLVLS
jgi:anti-sigma-K factor RsiG